MGPEAAGMRMLLGFSRLCFRIEDWEERSVKTYREIVPSKRPRLTPGVEPMETFEGKILRTPARRGRGGVQGRRGPGAGRRAALHVRAAVGRRARRGRGRRRAGPDGPPGSTTRCSCCSTGCGVRQHGNEMVSLWGPSVSPERPRPAR